MDELSESSLPFRGDVDRLTTWPGLLPVVGLVEVLTLLVLVSDVAVVSDAGGELLLTAAEVDRVADAAATDVEDGVDGERATEDAAGVMTSTLLPSLSATQHNT